jgi:hypothetical protein
MADSGELYERAERAYAEILRLRNEIVARSEHSRTLLLRCARSHEDTIDRLGLSVKLLDRSVNQLGKAGRLSVIQKVLAEAKRNPRFAVSSDEDFARRYHAVTATPSGSSC